MSYLIQTFFEHFFCFFINSRRTRIKTIRTTILCGSVEQQYRQPPVRSAAAAAADDNRSHVERVRACALRPSHVIAATRCCVVKAFGSWVPPAAAAAAAYIRESRYLCHLLGTTRHDGAPRIRGNSGIDAGRVSGTTYIRFCVSRIRSRSRVSAVVTSSREPLCLRA